MLTGRTFPRRIPDTDLPLTIFYHGVGFSPGINIMRYNKLDKEIDQARVDID